MSGINGICNGYSHLKSLSTQSTDMSYNMKTDINSVLPSITNLSNVSADVSFSSYLSSDSISMSNNVYNQNIILNNYQNNAPSEYSLPAMCGFSQINKPQYYNASVNGFAQQNDMQYQYHDYNYNPVISHRNWVDSYPNHCVKPPVQSFPLNHNSYNPNDISHSNSAGKDTKTVSKINVKDEKYSVRRQKNNIAAKKCRDNKKLKNQEVCDLIMRYEKDNEELKMQIESVKMKIDELMKQLH